VPSTLILTTAGIAVSSIGANEGIPSSLLLDEKKGKPAVVVA
jgi:hypothetical protein